MFISTFVDNEYHEYERPTMASIERMRAVQEGTNKSKGDYSTGSIGTKWQSKKSLMSVQ